MESDHIALERHPVADRALVLGFAGLGVLGTDEFAGAIVAVDLPYALGGGVFARFARNKVGLPHDVAALVVVARMLLGQVDVDIGLPVGLALGGKCVGLLGVRNFDLAGLLVVDGVFDLLGEPTVLKPLANSAAQPLICDVSSVGLAGSAKLIHCSTELPSTLPASSSLSFSVTLTPRKLLAASQAA